MIIFRKASALSEYLLGINKKRTTIGFVPTMGALHMGHISLIHAAKSRNELVVCSIFVNPVQFNNSEDFAKYPVTTNQDIELLENAGCNVLFLPEGKEVYPPNYIDTVYDIGPLEDLLEGAHRPGHFQGVCKVVDRLLNIVDPGALYLGQKDFQQCLVIKKLLQITGRETALHIIPTKREISGLAMSSRNLRLNEVQQKKASLISEALIFIKENLHKKSLHQLQAEAKQKLEDAGFIVDYVSIANTDSLKPSIDSNDSLVALIAATLDGVRLIDNEVLNSPSKQQ